MSTKLLLIAAIGLSTGVVYAQPTKNTQKLDSQVPHKKKYTAAVVDEDLGIDMYEKLNMFISADSVRLCNGYDCEGWVTDNYEDGTVIHKGFYEDGQLKIYKNFYPDGTLEREFKTIDNYRCTLKKYFPDGKVKSEVRYLHGTPQIWSDFYKNGNQKYYEEYHKSLTYHIEKKSFFENGTPEDELVLVHKKKLNYDKNEYHDNGQVKVDGEMKFSEESYDYIKTGTWKYFNESGAIKKELTYNRGRVSDEKTY